MLKVKKMWEIAARISRKYGLMDKAGAPLIKVTRIKDDRVEIRTELPSYAGGNEMCEAIQKQYPGWIVENQGGCAYIAYRPQ
jgi:hypothetical protein